MIENVLKQYKDNIALSDAKGTSLTYETLDQKSTELYDTIGGRTLVFSFCRNEAGSVLGYVTFLRYHIVPVLLNAEIETELRQQLIGIYELLFYIFQKKWQRHLVIMRRYGNHMVIACFVPHMPWKRQCIRS